MLARVVPPLLILAAALTAGCKDRKLTQLPLELTGMPKCPDWGYDPLVAFRLENGSDFIQDGYPLTPTPNEPHFQLISSWSAGKVTFKLGTCSKVNDQDWNCAQPQWLVTQDVDLKKTEHGYSLVVPKVTLHCKDGSTAQN